MAASCTVEQPELCHSDSEPQLRRWGVAARKTHRPLGGHCPETAAQKKKGKFKVQCKFKNIVKFRKHSNRN